MNAQRKNSRNRCASRQTSILRHGFRSRARGTELECLQSRERRSFVQIAPNSQASTFTFVRDVPNHDGCPFLFAGYERPHVDHVALANKEKSTIDLLRKMSKDTHHGNRSWSSGGRFGTTFGRRASLALHHLVTAVVASLIRRSCLELARIDVRAKELGDRLERIVERLTKAAQTVVRASGAGLEKAGASFSGV